MSEILTTDPDGFWVDKLACWELRDCVPEACLQCEAYLDQSRPCWVQDTLCKELLDIDTCDCCEVYRRYALRGQQGTDGAKEDNSSPSRSNGH